MRAEAEHVPYHNPVGTGRDDVNEAVGQGALSQPRLPMNRAAICVGSIR